MALLMGWRPQSPYERNRRSRPRWAFAFVMTVSDPVVLGCFAVLGASVLIVLSPARFFGRGLSYEEAFSVCWVAWSIYMGTFVVYVGLKLPLGLSRAANAPAVGMAVCISGNFGPLLGSNSHRLEECGDEIFSSHYSHRWGGRGYLFLPLSALTDALPA